MQRIATSKARILAPLQAVFDYAIDFERMVEWFPAVKHVEALNDLDPDVPGKRYLETLEMPLRGPRQIEITVVEAVRNKSFVTEGRLRPLWPRMEMRFAAADGDSTDFSWSMFSRNDRPGFRLLLPFVRRLMQRRADAALLNLRWTLDRQPVSPGPGGN